MHVAEVSREGRLYETDSKTRHMVTAERKGDAVAQRYLDMPFGCTHFARMTRKTVSLDKDVYRQIKLRQAPHESISAALRRMLEEEKDPADYLGELFRDFGGKGVMSDEGLARARGRQRNPAQSRRPARNQRHVHAA